MILKSTLVVAFVVATISMEPAAFAATGIKRADGNDQWVGTWSTALHQPNPGAGLTNAGFENQTLRQIVHISVGGNRVRVRLSTFGANALVIGAARIAIREQGPAIVPGSDRPLTFGGQSSITIPPGAPVLSDPVDLDVSALGDLAVSIYVPESTGPATWHFAAMQTSYVSPSGDFTGTAIMPVDSTRQAWFWLAGVEVMGPKQTGAIVTFGDSITDSANSTPNTNNRWPDHLARRLVAQPGQKTSVLNTGLAGNQLLHEIIAVNALARFDTDALTQTGVTHVIVMMGNNDIGVNWSGGVFPSNEVTAGQIIQGQKQLIQRAHARGLKIYGGTLTPFEGAGINLGPGGFFPYFSPANEAKRQAVNAWIRSGEYDAVIDFDQVLRDPNSPTRLLALYDSGDHLHPNDAGYKAMADAIDLKLFD
jgi:lysophospholipase L1-like esterase